MNKYIKADLYRIFTRIPRWILLVIAGLLVFSIIVPSKDTTSTGVETGQMLENILKYAPIFIGFLEIIYVFGEDFKGKTSQITIAIGVSRRRVVLAKWLEVIFLAIVDTAFLVLVANLACFFTPQRIPMEMFAELLSQFVICVVSVAAYMAIVLPILFLSQGTTLAMLIYILISSGLVQKLCVLLTNLKFFAAIHLSNLTLTNCLNVIRARILLGTFHIESLLGIIIYIVGFLTMTVGMYRRKELEF